MTSIRDPNRRAAGALVAALAGSGVTDACVSPGSRSTPIVLALAREPRIRSWVVTDERSAGFFALGMARETRRPVLLVCTSGTAAASYLPAVVEASLAMVPLVVATADRPPELRDSRAPQTIDQVRLFGRHARWSVDAPAPDPATALDGYWRALGCRAVATALEPPCGPVHLNLPFREPLLDVEEELAEPARRDGGPPAIVVRGPSGLPGDGVAAAVAATLASSSRGLVVCGPDAMETESVVAMCALAERIGWPILADPLSGLRFGPHERSNVLDAYDVCLRDPGFAASHAPDCVLQIGSLPVSKALARFLEAGRRTHLVVAPPGVWPDFLHAASEMIRAEPGALAGELLRILPRTGPSRWLESWRDSDRRVRAELDRRLAAEPEIFEGAIFRMIHDLLPDGAALHVGNSMPVRDVDAFLGGSPRRLRVFGNRGASGIDGVLSTALGAAAARREPTVLVLGDLSFLHDTGGLHLAARHAIRLVVVVVNNDGGGIFSFLPQAALGERFERFFGTPHGVDLAGAVAGAGGNHLLASTPTELAGAVEAALAADGLQVIEVRTDRARNALRHREIVGAALSSLRPAAEVA